MEESNILVAVRVRPVSSKEQNVKNGHSVVRVLDRKVVVVLDPEDEEEAARDVLRQNRSREKRYAFDFVFDEKSSNETVYECTAQQLIDGVLNGFNATVFAYGATGTGKTYSMIGTLQQPGIMVLTFKDLFEKIQNPHKDKVYKVTMSYLEVYNEMIRDLLNPSTEVLDLREDPIKGMVVAGITEHHATSADEVMELLRKGNRHRTQEATAANQVSSRSHAVLQVIVEAKDRTPNIHSQVKTGKLSLIDLAGSERASITQNRGQRMVEGANINRSLLALGNCINALGDKGNKGSFVNYRDSKLTRLLKDSLGGNCRTVMVATISPSAFCFEETHNTLKYANRAKNIRLRVQSNVMNVTYHIAQYTSIIADLRAEIAQLKQKISTLPEIEEGNEFGETQGKAEEDDMKRLRQEIIMNFQERMQIRRSLIDLEDLNLKNTIEVNKRQLEIARFEQQRQMGDGRGTRTPRQIRAARSEVTTIHNNVIKNNVLKDQLQRRLKENEEMAEHLRFELQKITNSNRRELLELEYKIHVLELENMELEEQSLLHESVLREKDYEIQRLIKQIQLRDNAIRQQQQLLRQHNLDSVVLPAMEALEQGKEEVSQLMLSIAAVKSKERRSESKSGPQTASEDGSDREGGTNNGSSGDGSDSPPSPAPDDNDTDPLEEDAIYVHVADDLDAPASLDNGPADPAPFSAFGARRRRQQKSTAFETAPRASPSSIPTLPPVPQRSRPSSIRSNASAGSASGSLASAPVPHGGISAISPFSSAPVPVVPKSSGAGFVLAPRIPENRRSGFVSNPSLLGPGPGPPPAQMGPNFGAAFALGVGPAPSYGMGMGGGMNGNVHVNVPGNFHVNAPGKYVGSAIPRPVLGPGGALAGMAPAPGALVVRQSGAFRSNLPPPRISRSVDNDRDRDKDKDAGGGGGVGATVGGSSVKVLGALNHDRDKEREKLGPLQGVHVAGSTEANLRIVEKIYGAPQMLNGKEVVSSKRPVRQRDKKLRAASFPQPPPMDQHHVGS